MGHFLCNRHWAMVPRKIRRQVDGAAQHGAPTAKYLRVKQAAIAAVTAPYVEEVLT